MKSSCLATMAGAESTECPASAIAADSSEQRLRPRNRLLEGRQNAGRADRTSKPQTAGILLPAKAVPPGLKVQSAPAATTVATF